MKTKETTSSATVRTVNVNALFSAIGDLYAGKREVVRLSEFTEKEEEE